MSDKVESVVDRIVETIKDGVRLGNYVPGQRLIENDFVSEMGFSRGPVREALRRLEAEGIVLLERNRGAVVRRWTREDIHQLYDIRELLEPQAAKLAAIIGAGDPERRKRIESSRRRMRKTAEDAVSAYVRENTRFHILIAGLSGNPWLERIISTLQVPVDRLAFFQFVTKGESESSLHAHEEIIEAILAGEAAVAEKAMRAHLKSSRKMVISLPDRAFR